MNRDETKRAAEEALWGDVYGATDRELWLDIERRKYARAFLAKCEREETVKDHIERAKVYFRSISTAPDGFDELDAAIKAIEEGR
jgi:hypothetical protein